MDSLFIATQMVDIHKEKVARREIGQLASAKNVVRAHKIQTPSQKERQQKYVRIKLDLNSLDTVGHGTKTGDTTSSVMDKRPPSVIVSGKILYAAVCVICCLCWCWYVCMEAFTRGVCNTVKSCTLGLKSQLKSRNLMKS